MQQVFFSQLIKRSLALTVPTKQKRKEIVPANRRSDPPAGGVYKVWKLHALIKNKNKIKQK